MEVSKLIELARIKLDDTLFIDDDVNLFKTDELIEYINSALREVVFRGKLLVSKNYSINLIAGTSEYKIPKGVINVLQVLDENKESITKTQEVDLTSNSWREDTNDLPCNFMQGNSGNTQLVFYPIPTKDSIVTLRASYYPIDEFEEADDIPTELPEIYHRDLLYWVLYEAFDRPDPDTYNPNKAEQNRLRFIEVFGEKVKAEQYNEIINYPENPGSHRDW